MSKPVKELIRKELRKRFEGVTSMAVAEFTKVDSVSNTQIRRRLREHDIHVTVVKNSLGRQVFDELGVPQAKEMLVGPSAVVYGGESVVSIVRELLAIGKEQPNLTVKSALLEGEVFPAERIEELSKYPTRDEAIAKVVGGLLGTGGGLVGALLGPGRTVGSLVKAVEEKQSEGGETEAA